jgi:hypothetical protein
MASLNFFRVARPWVHSFLSNRSVVIGTRMHKIRLHDTCPGGTTGIQRWSDLRILFVTTKDLTMSTEIKIIYSWVIDSCMRGELSRMIHHQRCRSGADISDL